jgi:nanoRNase/pAp phosphatase (c-di-AMP/oligoRNAs hydrolase)
MDQPSLLMPVQEKPEHTSAQYARRLLRFLSKHKSTLSPLLILTHNYPDPDALAAAFALDYLADQCYGIQTKIAYGGVIGRTENRAMVRILRIPVHKLEPADFQKHRNVALVDTQPRFENNPFPSKRRATIIIDQHPSIAKPSADLVLVDIGAGATCTIVAQALLLQGVQIPGRVATALAYGILSDTLDLYRAQRPDVVQTYLSVLPCCDMKMLARIQNPSHSRRFFLTLGKAIRGAIVNRGLILSHLGFIENPDLVSQMAEFLLTYQRVKWSVCTGRYRERLHVSLRTSQPYAQAGEILRDVFSNPKEAGGHGAIGGGSFRVGREPAEEDWTRAEQELQFRLFKRLRRSTKCEFQRPFLRD